MYTYDRYTPLNSNLILLIPPLHLSLIVPYLSLNSNLILLIQGAGRPGRSLVWSFKFQSDSINTTRISLAMYFFSSFKFQSDSINTGLRPERHQQIYRTLNSNLILLIRGGSL